MAKIIGFALLFCVIPLVGQSNLGELHLRVIDQSGATVKATVRIHSDATEYRGSFSTNDKGLLSVRRLPYGLYELQVSGTGFAPASKAIEIHSSLPLDVTLQLRLPALNESVTVTAANTLIDPEQAGIARQIGPDVIQDRVSSIPGRTLQDLVNSQPGWLYEGNAVLHPRGSEYQTQYVVDGVPLMENRSPGFSAPLDADDVQSLTIYTGGIPAEYGRKMGGVVEVDTLRSSQPGFHGQLDLYGGSFDSLGSSAEGEYGTEKNFLSAHASAAATDHYLNPVVPQNYSNAGTIGDFSADYERDLTSGDRLGMNFRHGLAHYDIPNEAIQQDAGQRQTAANIENTAAISYRHTFSSDAVADIHALFRDNSSDFNSNALSTPIEVFQRNFFQQGYFRATETVSHARQEWKFGVESDNVFLHENFSYHITDATRFDPDTPLQFSFRADRPDLEQSAFAQDQIRLKNWTINAGLRWDHYQLLLNRHAVSPRFAIARFLPSAALVLHFSYDRVFQTPSFENILLSSSSAVDALSSSFLRLPVAPSEGNYYEAGITKAFAEKVKLDASYFRRDLNNFADDDQLENTSISYPIAFRGAVIYGAEGKIEVPDWEGFSGFLSYSYMVGNVWFPVTGGLFLGDDASQAESHVIGHFPATQDQRNTVRTRVQYRINARFWIAGGVQYDSGLPFEFQGNPSLALAEYGPQVFSRINFARGRILPALLVSASAGVDVYKSDRLKTRFQIDGENLTNVLDVLDFGGLFSGNAIGPSRSFAMRLTNTF